MSKDFANRKPRTGTSRSNPSRGGSKRAAAPRTKKPTRPRKRAQPPRFHGPSFSGGIVLGAGLVLAGAYLPDFLLETVEQTVAVNEPQSRQPVQFEFDQRLRRSEVRTDPNTYADDVNPTAGMTIEYLIQAASFRTRDDADSLRAQLLLIDLPARTNAVEVGDKPWYRVTVGPFLSQVEAGRAMTRLREQNLDAFLIKREL